MKAVYALVFMTLFAHNLSGQVEVTADYDMQDEVTEILLMNYSQAQVNQTEGLPAWVLAFDRLQLVMTSIGIVANVLTIIFLWKAEHKFTSVIRILLQHQSFVDGLICFLSIPILTQPSNWTTGNKHYDIFMCHVWHSHVFFWAAIYVSVWNLVLIAIERYVAVIYPLNHNGFTKEILFLSIAIVYITSSIAIITGLMQVKFEDGLCSFITSPTYMLACGIYWFFAAYAVPFILFVILYGRVLITLHRRKSDITLGQSRIIDKASAQFTRTATMVILFFMVSLSFDSFYYLLATAGATTYIYGGVLQRLAQLLTCMNSVINPFIYVVYMPIFRQSLLQLLAAIKAKYIGYARHK